MSTTLTLHQTHHTLADFDAISEYLEKNLKGDSLHLFPELFLTGYPLQDLCLQRSFIDSYIAHDEARSIKEHFIFSAHAVEIKERALEF